MRPRKRDPKPNPVDEKIASLKQNDLRQQQNKPPLKPPQKFQSSSPNGVKIPMLDPSMGPFPYSPSPFPFWPPGFSPIPLGDYSRAAAAFPANPEFLASQMMQVKITIIHITLIFSLTFLLSYYYSNIHFIVIMGVF